MSLGEYRVPRPVTRTLVLKIGLWLQLRLNLDSLTVRLGIGQLVQDFVSLIDRLAMSASGIARTTKISQRLSDQIFAQNLADPLQGFAAGRGCEDSSPPCGRW